MLEKQMLRINSHEKILAAVAHSIKTLIDESDYMQAIETCFALLGGATGVDRVYMFENIYAEDGSGKTYQSIEWNSGIKAAQIENPKLQALPFSDVASFIEPLRQDKAFYGIVRDFEDSGTREILESQEVLSIVVLPVFVREIFWGFIGFDECKTERIWRESEFSALLAFASAVESAIERNLIVEELKEAKRNAESANVMKSHFLANMSHEIRTPMNGIMGFTKLLQETSLTLEQKEYVHEIQTASENLLLLINDILDLSKIEAGKMEIEKCRFNLRNMIEHTLMVFVPKLSRKGVQFHVMVDDEVPDEVIGDVGRIRQIMNNLVDNALKFTHEGEVKVIVSCHEQDDKYAKVDFEIQDTGIGIAEKNLQKLFKPFTQADSSTTRQFGGTGLGLAICKELVQLMKGEISAKSTEGIGSTFKFNIQIEEPRKAIIEKVAPMDEKIATQKIEEENIHKHLNILVAEDNEMNRKVMMKLLKLKGIEAEFASNGLEAYEALKENEYDLIFMDCQMPVMDGYECTAKIRALEGKKKETVIIAMTAHAMEGDREKCLQAGMDDYISKPLDFERVFLTLDKYNDSKNQLKTMIEESKKQFLIDTGLPTEDIIELYEEYERELPSMVHKMIEAFREKRMMDILFFAHQLKGASGSLRVKKIYEFSEAIEKAAQENQAALCHTYLLDLERIINVV